MFTENKYNKNKYTYGRTRSAIDEASGQSLTVFHWLFILYWIPACVAAVRKGRGRELGRETAREGGGRREERTPTSKLLFWSSRLLIKKK